MAKGGMNKFLDMLKLSDPDDDEFDDDLFDDDEDDYDDDYDDEPKKSKSKKNKPSKIKAKASYDYDYDDDDFLDDFGDYEEPKKAKTKSFRSNSKLVAINNNRNVRSNQVYVIKPTDFNDAQEVADGLKAGKPTVINMEGMGVDAAQRIIDFIGGACYALDGTLQAISGNIFIASPNNVEVTGDLREELLGYNSLPPDLGRY